MKRLALLLLLISSNLIAQTDTKIYDIINAVSSERMKADITTLANFGTRHTLSDTISNTRGLATAPPSPKNVGIGGIVEASAKFSWDKVEGTKGYKIYWRDTTSPTWDNFKYVENTTEFTLNRIAIDNFFFGVASVGKNGDESVVSFPLKIIR